MLDNKREGNLELDLDNPNGPDSSHSRNILIKITLLFS